MNNKQNKVPQFRSSHVKKRPFDFKLIDLVEPNPVLYMRQMPGMSAFEMMKAKNSLWQQISDEMGYPVQMCLNRWDNLRRSFQKELKFSNTLCPKRGLIRIPTWPYLERLRFLECTIQANKPKKEKHPKRKVKQVIPEDIAKLENMDSTFSEGEHEDELDVDDDNSLIEEITGEIQAEHDQKLKQEDISENNANNYRRIEALLTSFEGENLERIERRLYAFLCKCQLRAINEQTIEDLSI